jgi:hypothetical protein
MVRNSRTGLGLIVGLALATAAPSAQDAATVIGGASKALGVDTLKTVQYSATGFDFALGQAPNPSSPWPKFINKSYRRAVDFEKGASKVDRVRAQGENPPHGGGEAADRAVSSRRARLSWSTRPLPGRRSSRS